MTISPETMRSMLVLCALGMTLLAAFYLRQRDLTLTETIRWSLLIVLLPLLGPFLVIISKPGGGRTDKTTPINNINGSAS